MATGRGAFRTIGFLYQSVWGKLLLLAAAVTLLSLGGGLLVTYGFGEFDSFGDGAWWAFLHLLDPGAVLEDETWPRRVLGSFLVVCGVVLIIGILFEVLTQVVDRSLSRLDETTVSVPHSGHVVFDGWRWSLPGVIEEMGRVLADPVGHVAIVAPTDLYDERASMRSALRRRRPPKVELLFGDARDSERLERTNALAARSVVVVGDDSRRHDPATVDLDVLKRVLHLAEFLDRSGADHPAVFYELNEGRNAKAAADLVPREFGAIVLDGMASDILKLAVLEPSWAVLIDELLAETSGIRIRAGEEWVGASLRSVEAEIGDLVVATLSAPGAVDLDPDRPLGVGDRIVALPWNVGGPAQPSGPPVEVSEPTPRRISIAIVGWNQTVSTFISALRAMGDVTFEISSIAPVAEGTRASELAAAGVMPDAVDIVRVPPRDTAAMRRALARQSPDAVIVASTVDGSGDDAMRAADAAAVFDLLSIRQMSVPPRLVLADLLTPDSAGPIGEGPTGAIAGAANEGLAPVIPIAAVLDRIAARMFAHPELGSVLDALIGDGARRPVELTVTAGGPARFIDVRRQLWTPHRNVVGAIVDGRPTLSPDAATTIGPGCQLLAFCQ